MISSLSNWIELVSIATLAAKWRNGFGQLRRVPDGQVGLGRRPEIVERLEEAEAGLGDQRPAVVAHAADRFRHPGRIAGEQLVIFRRAQETDDAQLDDEVVDDLLRLLLGDQSGFEVALEIDVEEGRRRGPATSPRRSAPSLAAR